MSSPTLNIRPIFRDLDAPLSDYHREVAQTKRLLESWSADPELRQKVAHQWLRSWAEGGPPSLQMQRHTAFVQEKLDWRAEVCSAAPSHPGWKAWRERQMRRCRQILGQEKSEAIVFAPIAFELSRGCSVGCWFCGVSAPKLTDLWRYTSENQAMWRGVLKAFAEVSQGAQGGFCYWATDPLDNPDYEDFCLDFRSILGVFPQTTTALGLRDVERTRRLLQLSQRNGALLNRFSLLSLKQLQRVHQEFTPEETLRVEMLLQHNEATLLKANAGRARQRAWKEGQARQTPESAERAGTIACVAGFLVSMPDRKIQLISPCNADSTWPMGYRIHAQGSFDSPQEFRDQLLRMTSEEFMPRTLPYDRAVGWRSDLKYSQTADGIQLEAPFQSIGFHSRNYPALAELGRCLQQAQRKPSELALWMEQKHGMEMATTLFFLGQIFSLALLDDEPGGSSPGRETTGP